jgi:ATP-dependent DNA helicase RecG
MTVEFKSDLKRLPDTDLVAAVVCLTNTEGGVLYLGVEADGSVSGLHQTHRDMPGLAALIANRTNPPVSVRASIVVPDCVEVGKIEVPKSPRLVATSDGLLQRRMVKADGTPECVPFYPHEFVGRQSALGLFDLTAQPVAGSSVADLDPLERERLRRMIETYHGDAALLGLTDEQLDGALGFVRQDGSTRMPTYVGLLLIGKEEALRERVPTHEAAFQVLEGTDVKVNHFWRWPLLKLFEEFQREFESRLEQREVQVGLFRVGIPSVDPRSLREALVNAQIHRDYSRMGALYVRMDSEVVSISNPGGFVEGVTLQNLLTVEPKPRNPALADAVKRIGLAERTGRGVDIIYEGLLRYGRPDPDYSRSDGTSVVVRLRRSEADLDFVEMIVREENRRQTRLPLQSLLVLSRLRQERRISVAELAEDLNWPVGETRGAVEGLVEAGLVEGQGARRGRVYTLSAAVYRAAGKVADYVRQAGYDRIQQEQMVLRYVESNGRITRRDVMNMCHLDRNQAAYVLRRLVDEGRLRLVGYGRGAQYVLS